MRKRRHEKIRLEHKYIFLILLIIFSTIPISYISISRRNINDRKDYMNSDDTKNIYMQNTSSDMNNIKTDYDNGTVTAQQVAEIYSGFITKIIFLGVFLAIITSVLRPR